MSDMLSWADKDWYAGSSLRGFLDVAATPEAVKRLEAAAGVVGSWDMNEFGGWDWDGLRGTYRGYRFNVYSHKSGMLKVGAFDDMPEAVVTELVGVLRGIALGGE